MASSPGAAWRRAAAVCAVVVLTDQAAKAAVAAALAPGERLHMALGFVLTRTTNRGLAFGVLGGGGGVVVAITLVALALVLTWFALDPTRAGLWLGVGLLAGGALGNLTDRVRADAVTDFIDPPAWPAFNLADVAITAGAVVLVLISLQGSGPDREAGANRPTGS